MLLDGIPYHLVNHLIFGETLFPFELSTNELYETLKLILVEEYVPLWLGGCKNLGGEGRPWVHFLWDGSPTSILCLLGV